MVEKAHCLLHCYLLARWSFYACHFSGNLTLLCPSLEIPSSLTQQQPRLKRSIQTWDGTDSPRAMWQTPDEAGSSPSQAIFSEIELAQQHHPAARWEGFFIATRKKEVKLQTSHFVK